MTHTPGPWRTYPNAEGLNLEIETANDFPPAEIARVHWMADGKNNEALKQESLANARLIAVAPELLEACEKALLDIHKANSLIQGTPGVCYLASAKATLKQAIAIAEGR